MDAALRGYTGGVRRISCSDLALNYACDRVFEAETDDDVLEQALAHARDEHDERESDRERWRPLIAAGDER